MRNSRIRQAIRESLAGGLAATLILVVDRSFPTIPRAYRILADDSTIDWIWVWCVVACCAIPGVLAVGLLLFGILRVVRSGIAVIVQWSEIRLLIALLLPIALSATSSRLPEAVRDWDRRHRSDGEENLHFDVEESWLDQRSKGFTFSVVWRQSPATPSAASARVTLTNDSNETFWYYGQPGTTSCIPVVIGDTAKSRLWHRPEEPVRDCGLGFEGDAWRPLNRGETLALASSWLRDRSEGMVRFVVPLYRRLRRGRYSVDATYACSRAMRIDE